MHQFLIFGTEKSTKPIVRYLGYDKNSSKAIIYFEFPNKKFNHPKILKEFPNRIKLYHLRPPILQTVLAPKREFSSTNAILWIFDSQDRDSIEEGFKYFKKFALTRKEFVPIFFIGVRQKEEKIKNKEEESRKFLQNLFLTRKIGELLQVPVLYFEIMEKVNEGYIIRHTKKLIEEILENPDKPYIPKKYSTIIIEDLLEDIKELIEENHTLKELDELMPLLIKMEYTLQRPITRKKLIEEFGAPSEIAAYLLNDWERRPKLDNLSKETQDLLSKEATLVKKIMEKDHIPLNLPSLLIQHYDYFTSKYILRYLYEENQIPSISHHIESREYLEFQNIREIIVLHEGRTLFVKTTSPKIDQPLLFSNMIQALEVTRDQYLKQVESNIEIKKHKIENLEFGELRAIIANGNKGVKAIIRLHKRPINEKEFRKRVKNFIIEYENTVPLKETTDPDEQKEIRQKSERIFYKHFNPFPINIDVFRVLTVSRDVNEENLTDIELKVLKLVREKQPLLIEDLFQEWAKRYGKLYSRSDLLLPILTLIEEKILY